MANWRNRELAWIRQKLERGENAGGSQLTGHNSRIDPCWFLLSGRKYLPKLRSGHVNGVLSNSRVEPRIVSRGALGFLPECQAHNFFDSPDLPRLQSSVRGFDKVAI